MENYFEITYCDNSRFKGDPLNRDWLKVADKLIKKVEYCFCRKAVVLEGFKEYNHILHKVAFQKEGIEKSSIMGRMEGRTLILDFNLKEGKLQRRVRPIGQEEDQMLLKGWKEGYYNRPRAYIVGDRQ